jgi:hypothetical protein
VRNTSFSSPSRTVDLHLQQIGSTQKVLLPAKHLQLLRNRVKREGQISHMDTSTASSSGEGAGDTAPSKEPKSSLLQAGKRALHGLRKKDGTQGEDKTQAIPSRSINAEPTSTGHSAVMPSSPTRHPYASSTQGHSPASSQIFERDVVQSESLGAAPSSPSVPHHVGIEDHIPPVLEASSLAITNDHLKPSDVDIATHSHHLPAAAGISGASTSDLMDTGGSGGHEGQLQDSTAAATYGSGDLGDVRRLSFISFADIVQSEHIEHSSASPIHRSPSPGRSPSSRDLSSSPVHSTFGQKPGPDISMGEALHSNTPSLSHSPIMSEEPSVRIQTMAQALRKTASGDLTDRNQPRSATSDDGTVKRPWN